MCIRSPGLPTGGSAYSAGYKTPDSVPRSKPAEGCAVCAAAIRVTYEVQGFQTKVLERSNEVPVLVDLGR